jgi:hypothetical protein
MKTINKLGFMAAFALISINNAFAGVTPPAANTPEMDGSIAVLGLGLLAGVLGLVAEYRRK